MKTVRTDLHARSRGAREGPRICTLEAGTMSALCTLEAAAECAMANALASVTYSKTQEIILVSSIRSKHQMRYIL